MSAALQILVVDDDEVSREVLSLLLGGQGYAVETADSGDAALAHLRDSSHSLPGVVLADLQMPGMHGDELSRQLRAVCGPQTILIAMSGSQPEAGLIDGFNAFLLKPFSMEQLAALVNGTGTSMMADEAAGALNEAVYQKLAGSMNGSQLEKLYSMCLSDAEKRIGEMKQAAASQDDVAYKREAHAIKGGCGMVGAAELQILANTMETKGIEANHVATLNEFLLASERLRRILVARKSR